MEKEKMAISIENFFEKKVCSHLKRIVLPLAQSGAPTLSITTLSTTTIIIMGLILTISIDNNHHNAMLGIAFLLLC
jgi:hypothetical protein